MRVESVGLLLIEPEVAIVLLAAMGVSLVIFCLGAYKISSCDCSVERSSSSIIVRILSDALRLSTACITGLL